MKFLSVITLSVLINFLSFPQSGAFVKGADISFVPQIENLGGGYYSNNVVTDPLQIFSQNGAGYIRLRLWHTPAGGYCGLDTTIKMAQRIKQKGLKFLLDFHYSDNWADPGKQTKPAAWTSLVYTSLKDSIYSYTKNVISAFKNANAAPDMVQIGNEITAGFLWPEGRVGGTYNTTQQWTQFTDLLKSARNGVMDASPGPVIPIMIHIDRGGDNSGSRWFYDKLISYSVPFDIIGLSFYPWWHGTLTALSANLNDLASRYGKDIIVAETAYPWTLSSYDNVGNIVGTSSQLHTGYPATVVGQYNFLYDLIQIIKNVPNNKGKGIFYWAPEYISVQPIGSPWENLATFDFTGHALSSLTAFKDNDTSGAVNVTFRLNTATHWDTLKSSGFVQLRGEIINGPDVLVSGEQLKWDVNSQVILTNTSGDYWQRTVRMVPGNEIQYKYWTGHTRTNPTFVRLGWEGPVTPYDTIAGNYRKFVAGINDTVLQMEYYNSSGTTVTQYWSPFKHKQDTIALYFKVNMQGVTSTGRFNPVVNGPVGIRGGAVGSLPVLSWDTTKIIFAREPYSIMSGSFWSGTVYYPASLAGQSQAYKFFIENDSGNGWENQISDRTVKIPSGDSTVAWVSFDNQAILTDINGNAAEERSFDLLNNYPNPFNNSTVISYSVPAESYISIKIYNHLGEEIRTLVGESKPAGKYKTTWDGLGNNSDALPSGVYIIQCNSSSFTKSLKAVLLK